MKEEELKKFKKSLVITGIVITMFGIFSTLAGPAILTLFTKKTGSIDVPPGNCMTLTFHFDVNDEVEGYFSVRGGNDDIRFYIKDPFGKTIYASGIVTGRHDFSLTANTEGAYTLYFENSFSWVTPKRIYLTTSVIGTIAGFKALSLSGFILMILGVVSIVVGVVLKPKR
ncbi:MAG: emp24/gp25L/p24 family protein [Candidatus Latescibacteria bacterium]|nr:emp24/gp25L/p24 family protein [Candidatus Latescibacterota bacterium]